MKKLNGVDLKDSFRVGVCFGLTSAVITTLGLLIGLYASTGSKLAVIGGILTIAVADAFSDALGIHLAEESENKHSQAEIFLSTVFTFLAKFIFALTFLVPVIIFSLKIAVIVSVIWGLGLLAVVSFQIAKSQEVKAYRVITEHLSVAVVVIIIADFIGRWIAYIFAS